MDDAIFGFQHRGDFEKIAVVTGRKGVKWAIKIGERLLAGQIMIFSETQFRRLWNGSNRSHSEKKTRSR